MKRSLWKQTIFDTLVPPWPCPICRKGTIALVPKSLIHEETIESKQAHRDEDWDPDWIRYTLTAWGECGHPSCKQRFAIAGDGGVAPEYGDEGEMEWGDYFLPRVCHPMPEIFDVPAKCPPEAGEELRAAFALFWSQQASCAGRIRVALECLMNSLGVPKRRKDKTGKYFDLSLHTRIDEFAKKEPTIGPQLMALKWLGNAGSHTNREVSKDDLLDAFEIMEHALAEIIEKRSAKVAALAKKLTLKHGHK
jgi:hypothetical protein